ncbi:MAG: hypothetical protein KGN01_06055 [Patescibacteria group bacterium]|nr:hypothetical protein [Patescibacteria group bacterium]
MASSVVDAVSTNQRFNHPPAGYVGVELNPILRVPCGRNLSCLDLGIQVDAVAASVALILRPKNKFARAAGLAVIMGHSLAIVHNVGGSGIQNQAIQLPGIQPQTHSPSVFSTPLISTKGAQ